MSADEDDREQMYQRFEENIQEQLNPPSASGKNESEDAPHGVCFQNQLWNCGPACVAFIPFDVDEDGKDVRWNERCEILMSKRIQARALVNIDRHLYKILGAQKMPSATDGPAPPPSPRRG